LTLRRRLLALFLALATAPILALGGLTYVQSVRALESLLGRQTAELASRASAGISDRMMLRESDLLLLTENAQTQRLFREMADHGQASAAAREAAERFLPAVWAQVRDSYESIELLTTEGRVIMRLGETAGPEASDPRPRTWLARREIRDGSGERLLGILSAQLRVDPLLPTALLETRFGSAGRTIVVDRTSGRVVYHVEPSRIGRPLSDLLPSGTNVAVDASASPLHIGGGDSARVASVVALNEPPWSVIATAATAEFAGPFHAMRTLNLAVVLAVTAAMTLVFVVMLRRSTQSLTRLTSAADAVGRGEFAPVLPAAGDDEVGRLTTAFAAMVTRIRTMIVELEQSRQMAVLGEFAAHVSHEIRNPLTSIKLNLQSLERDVRAGTIPADARVPLEITLREIRRLESVVRGVLDLTRQPSPNREVTSLHRILQNAVDLVHAQAERQGISLQLELAASQDGVRAAVERLGSAVLNLLLNAVDAMPEGGSLDISTASVLDENGCAGIVVLVRDTGPGVPDEMRDAIFRPFHTGKPGGTGLGLPLARRIAEEHGGRLVLEPPGRRGAVFRLELPLAAEPTPRAAAAASQAVS
jgi:signal transduction histidine kinase